MKASNRPLMRLAALLTLIPAVAILMDLMGWIYLPNWAEGVCYLLIAISMGASIYLRRDEQRASQRS